MIRDQLLIRKPVEKGPFHTIFFIQGLGMTKHEWRSSFDEIARRLQSAGFKTVQFDFPIFQNGVTREVPLKKRATIVEEIAQQYKPDGLLAQSYGATTSLVATLPTVKTQVLVGPALSPMQSIKQSYEEVGMKINWEGDTTMPRSSGENTTVGVEFWEDIKDFNDIRVARNIKIPTCILHGDHDTKIPVDVVRKFYDAISAKKKLKIYKGGDHGINDVPRRMRDEFLQDVVTWFKETL